MIISAIAAIFKNGFIGFRGKLPWHIPEDLKFFKEKTRGKIILIGRKTLETLPKPLPGRKHLVITRDSQAYLEVMSEVYRTENVEVFSSVDDALVRAQVLMNEWPDEVFVVGGGEIYFQTMDLIDRLYLTEVDRDVEGDARFPLWDRGQFIETSREEHEGFRFLRFDRKI